MSNMLARVSRWMGLIGLAALGAPAAHAEWGLNMTPGVTAISREVYGLHMLIFGVCVVIAIVVFGLMIISIIRHRKSLGVKPATFSHSTKAEIVWTIIPILILVAMAVPAAGTLIRMEDTRNSDLTVKVTGYQWKWHYDYIDDGVAFFSTLSAESNRARQLDSGIDPNTVENYLLDVDNPLVVPVNAKVRLLLTSNDVIHSWWVPDFGGKKDAIPGFINTFWFQADVPGTYRGQCTELCGRDHGFMPVVVEVLEEDAYAEWLAANAPASDEVEIRTAALTSADMAAPAAVVDVAAEPRVWTLDSLMADGEPLHNTNCSACHQVNGQGLAAAGFPALAGSAVATGDIAAHIDIAVNGKAGTAMAAFGPQLSDEQLAAIITYQRNAWGNATGDLVSPEDVRAAR